MRHRLMPVAFFFAEHQEMLHRLSASLCLSLASAAERQAKNDRNHSKTRHSKPRHSKPPRCRPPTQLLFISEPQNRVFEKFVLDRVAINHRPVAHVDVKHSV